MEIHPIEAAKYLGVSVATVRRWIRQGKIPAKHVNNVYMLNKKELALWCKQHHIAFQDLTTEKREDVQHQEVNIAQAIARGGIYFGLPGNNKQEVLRSAVDSILLSKDIDKEVLINHLLKREELASTGIGNGVAIPHPRYPLEEIPEEGIIPTFFLKKKIDYDAVDGRHVFVLFLMLSHDTEHHLKMLSRLCYFLRDKKFISFLRSCQSQKALLSKVEQMEKVLKSELKERPGV